MTAALLLAATATMPLGVWPDVSGTPILVSGTVEIYLAEPEEDFWALAVQPLEKPIEVPDEAAVAGLVTIATRLGADAVLLLRALPIARIPEDLDAPLVGSGSYTVAVYLLFDCACDEPPPRGFRARVPTAGERHGGMVAATR